MVKCANCGKNKQKRKMVRGKFTDGIFRSFCGRPCALEFCERKCALEFDEAHPEINVIQPTAHFNSKNDSELDDKEFSYVKKFSIICKKCSNDMKIIQSTKGGKRGEEDHIDQIFLCNKCKRRVALRFHPDYLR
jgi:hypothetical protein